MPCRRAMRWGSGTGLRSASTGASAARTVRRSMLSHRQLTVSSSVVALLTACHRPVTCVCSTRTLTRSCESHSHTHCARRSARAPRVWPCRVSAESL
eukprot:6470579-Prymnesium_polylepis.1